MVPLSLIDLFRNPKQGPYCRHIFRPSYPGLVRLENLPRDAGLHRDRGLIPLLGRLLGGSWDLVSPVISTLIGDTSNYNYSYLFYNLRD